MIKASWESEFNDLTELLEDEIKRWLVTFVNNNEDHLASVESCIMYLKKLRK
jgi:hypothetical protein